MHWGIVCEHGFVFLHHIHNLLGSGISKHRGWRKSLWGSLKITITARIWCSISNLMHLCICVSFCHFKFVFTLFFASSCLNFRNISSRFKSDSRNNLCFSICTLASWSTLAVSCDKACCCERTIFLFLWEATRVFFFLFWSSTVAESSSRLSSWSDISSPLWSSSSSTEYSASRSND